MRGLFINQVKNHCSIYESGLMIFNALMSTNELSIDYMEVQMSDVNKLTYHGYDFYIFNWHHNTLPIPKYILDGVKGLKIGIILEVGPIDIKPFMPEDLFDAYMVIDPTKENKDKYYAFPRPLEKAENLLPLLSNDVPVFGTFGFFVVGKNFGEVIQQANKYGKDCIVRMNLPEGKFTGVPLSSSVDFANRLKRFASSNVDLRVTYDYMDKQTLIAWCSQHTVNIFPYYRDFPGLSATTDQAISAGRGIAVTNCNTFRHLHKYINYFPNQDYIQLSESTLSGIKQMQDDWSNDKFISKFNKLLLDRLGR